MTTSPTFDPTRALPNRCYRDAGVFEHELANIWHSDWVFVGTEGDVPSPGDRMPVMVGNQPVIITRTASGELVATSNLCSHRGTLLLEQACNQSKIACPYHAWVFDEHGKLAGAPHATDEELDRERHCLPRYRVESWMGLLFVSLDDNVEPLRDRFAIVEPYARHWQIDQLHPWPTVDDSEPWNANWKLVLANAMESYHVFRVHKQTLQPAAPTSGAYYLAGSAHATATAGTMKDAPDYLLLSLPPTFVGIAYPGSFIWQAVAPLGHDRTRVFTGGFFEQAAPSDRHQAIEWMKASESSELPDFLPEDRDICERGQRGAIGDNVPGKLLAIEHVVVDFHHYLASRLHGAALPAPHIEHATSDL